MSKPSCCVIILDFVSLCIRGDVKGVLHVTVIGRAFFGVQFVHFNWTSGWVFNICPHFWFDITDIPWIVSWTCFGLFFVKC